MHRPALAFVVVLLALSAAAQTRIGTFRPAGSIGPARIVVRGHRPFFPAGYYPIPYFYDSYDPYEVEYLPPEPPRPEPIVQMKTEPLPDPVLLELHGGQWVKVANFSAASDHAVAMRRAEGRSPASKPLPPAILVFRDGHSEEVSSYSIIGPVIFTKTDYWSSGKWTRSIAIDELNIPATLRQNKARGVDFELPSSPDEVMLRP